MIKKNVITNISDKINTHHKSINKLILFFGLILILFLLVLFIENYELIGISKKIIAILKTIAVIIGSYFIASIFVKLTLSWAVKFIRESNVEQKIMFTKMYITLIYLIATAFVLWQIGVSIQNIALISGLFATGLAFALREVLLSYFVWLILLVKKPFRIGDNIKIGEEEGEVKYIGTFYVILDNTPDKKENLVKIPNKIFIEKPINNYGKEYVPTKINVTINQEIKDIGKKMNLLKDKINFVKFYKEPYLEFIDGKLYVTLQVTTQYEKRIEDRNKIIELILNIFK